MALLPNACKDSLVVRKAYEARVLRSPKSEKEFPGITNDYSDSSADIGLGNVVDFETCTNSAIIISNVGRLLFLNLSTFKITSDVALLDKKELWNYFTRLEEDRGPSAKAIETGSFTFF